MPPLTWRNVDAPSFSSSNELLKYAGQAFNAGFDTLDKTVGDFQGALTTRDSNALMAEALKYQDPAAMAAALQAGTLTNGIDTRNLNKDSLDFLNKRVGDLYGDKQAGATLTGTNLINDGRAFDLGVAKDDRARLEEMRTLQPAANDLLVEARTLASSGRPEDLARAREIINNNTALFTNSGLDLPSMLGMVSGNESAFQSGLTNNQNVRTSADWWKNVAMDDASKVEVNRLINSTARPEDAIKLIQTSSLDAEIKKKAITELQTNAGIYYPTGPSSYDLLMRDAGFGAPAGMSNQESGGNTAAVNKDTGATGTYQITQPRLQDAIDAGVVPKGTTLSDLGSNSEIQDRVNQWHWNDINKFIANSGVQQYLGQTINGVPITVDSMRAMAQLGGNNGMKKFIESNGAYDPADANGVKISDYGKKFANAGAASPSDQLTAAASTQPIGTSGNYPETDLPVPQLNPVVPGTPDSNGVPTLPGEVASANESTTLLNSLTADEINNQLQPIDFAISEGKYKNVPMGQLVRTLIGADGSLSGFSEGEVNAGINRIMKEGKVNAATAAIILENSIGDYKKNIFGDKPLLDQILGTNTPTLDIDKAIETLGAYKNRNKPSDTSSAVARLNALKAATKAPDFISAIDALQAEADRRYQENLRINPESAKLEYEFALNEIQKYRDALGSSIGNGSITNQYGKAQDKP